MVVRQRITQREKEKQSETHTHRKPSQCLNSLKTILKGDLLFPALASMTTAVQGPRPHGLSVMNHQPWGWGNIRKCTRMCMQRLTHRRFAPNMDVCAPWYCTQRLFSSHLRSAPRECLFISGWSGVREENTYFYPWRGLFFNRSRQNQIVCWAIEAVHTQRWLMTNPEDSFWAPPGICAHVGVFCKPDYIGGTQTCSYMSVKKNARSICSWQLLSRKRWSAYGDLQSHLSRGSWGRADNPLLGIRQEKCWPLNL